MKVMLTGRYLEDIIPLVKKEGFDIVESDPEVMITHGGDGTLLGAESKYPGLPKFPMRDRQTAPLCEKHSYEFQLKQFKEAKLAKKELIKIAGFSGNHFIEGINDIFIHNIDRVGALRYRVWIDNELYAHEVVGDGVGVSTVHGSTAYYRSITHSTFRVGIGLAFSNSTKVTDHLVIPEDSKVRIKIVRGPGIMVADNKATSVKIDEGGEITIRKIEKKAVVYGLEMFMCPECRKLRHKRNMS